MITVLFTLSDAGRKALLLAHGKPVEARAETEILRDDPASVPLLDKAEIDSHGRATIDIRQGRFDWEYPEFDAPPTGTQVLATLAAEVERKVAAAAQKKADDAAYLEKSRREREEEHARQREVLTGILRDRLVMTTPDGSQYPETRCNMVGVLWPKFIEEFEQLPEWVAWASELQIANDKIARELADQKASAKAAEDALAEAAAKAKAARRKKLKLADNEFDFGIEEGALTNAPRWEDKNWCATISVNPARPGGLGRNFWAKAKGRFFYIVPANLSLGDPLEFGADSEEGRTTTRSRWYGFVSRITKTEIVVTKSAGGEAACRAGAEFAKSRPKKKLTAK